VEGRKREKSRERGKLLTDLWCAQYRWRTLRTCEEGCLVLLVVVLVNFSHCSCIAILSGRIVIPYCCSWSGRPALYLVYADGWGVTVKLYLALLQLLILHWSPCITYSPTEVI